MGAWIGMGHMLEKRWIAVPPQTFTANGTADGQISLINTAFFKVKQEVLLQSSTVNPPLKLEVKRITDKNTMFVGPLAGNIDARIDVSSLVTADGAFVFANEQKRSSVPEQEVERLTYEEEPVVARRVIGVDRFGNTVNWSEDGIVPQEFDDVQLDRDLEGDIIEARFYQDGVLERDLELTYDINKDLIRVRKI
jgi:hypothetical protein